jgi:hypothetical protein
MVEMRLKLNDELDRKISLYRTLKELNSKQEAILDVLSIYFIKNPGQFEKLINKEVK